MNIFISDKKRVDQKVKKIKKDGLERFHVISDFDRTLTKCFLNGKRIPSAISLIREGGYLSETYVKKAFALYDTYYPIEIDSSLDLATKSKKMVEWWEGHRDLMIASGMNRDVIEDILDKYPKMMREGSEVLLDFLFTKNIPLLIFSSGNGNLIEGNLKRMGKLTENVFILSNTFVFDSNGVAIGYKDPVIHVFNKSEQKISDEKYTQAIIKRKNVLLLGDSLGDLGMVDEKDVDTIIRVGFLNEEIENNKELYMKNFDVVVTDDGSMSWVNTFLNSLI